MRKCSEDQMIKDLPPFHSDRTSPLMLVLILGFGVYRLLG